MTPNNLIPTLLRRQMTTGRKNGKCKEKEDLSRRTGYKSSPVKE